MPDKVEEEYRSLAAKVLRGASAAAEAVRHGLGAGSRRSGPALVAQAQLAEPDERLGAHALRAVAERTAAAAGDGTRTAAILAHAILDGGLRALVAGASAVGLKRGLERGLCAAIGALRRLTQGTGGPAGDDGGSRGEELVPGAGLALLRTIGALEREEALTDGDEQRGLRVLERALEAPVRQIAEDWGLEPDLVLARMRADTGNLGVDAANGAFVDLVAAGILDPTRVLCVALQNAVSVAGDLLVTEIALATTRSAPTG
jgi:chaperonin GroEL (HSP60 family)